MARKGIVSRSYATARDSVSLKHWKMVYLASGMAMLSILLLVSVSGIPSISGALQSYWLAPKETKIYFVPDAPIARLDIGVVLERDLSFEVREQTIKVFSDLKSVSKISAKLIPTKTGTACSGADPAAVELQVNKSTAWSFAESDGKTKVAQTVTPFPVTSELTLIPIPSAEANVRQLEQGVSQETEVRYLIEGIFRERGTLVPLVTPPTIAAQSFGVRFERPGNLTEDLEVALCWGKDSKLSAVPIAATTTTLDGKVVTVWESGAGKTPITLPEHTHLALELRPKR